MVATVIERAATGRMSADMPHCLGLNHFHDHVVHT